MHLPGPRPRVSPWLIVVGLRGFLSIPLFGAVAGLHRATAVALLVSALATDLLDGVLARRQGACTSGSLQAYADPFADMIVVLTGFGASALRGVLPWWIVPILLAAFLQFVITSGPGGPVYDPVGKYLGTGLYAILLVVLVFPDAARLAVMASLASIGICVVGRWVYLLRSWMDRGEP